jgi:hypothetical protein
MGSCFPVVLPPPQFGHWNVTFREDHYGTRQTTRVKFLILNLEEKLQRTVTHPSQQGWVEGCEENARPWLGGLLLLWPVPVSVLSRERGSREHNRTLQQAWGAERRRRHVPGKG